MMWSKLVNHNFYPNGDIYPAELQRDTANERPKSSVARTSGSLLKPQSWKVKLLPAKYFFQDIRNLPCRNEFSPAEMKFCARKQFCNTVIKFLLGIQIFHAEIKFLSQKSNFPSGHKIWLWEVSPGNVRLVFRTQISTERTVRESLAFPHRKLIYCLAWLCHRCPTFKIRALYDCFGLELYRSILWFTRNVTPGLVFWKHRFEYRLLLRRTFFRLWNGCQPTNWKLASDIFIILYLVFFTVQAKRSNFKIWLQLGTAQTRETAPSHSQNYWNGLKRWSHSFLQFDQGHLLWPVVWLFNCIRDFDIWNNLIVFRSLGKGRRGTLATSLRLRTCKQAKKRIWISLIYEWIVYEWIIYL